MPWYCAHIVQYDEVAGETGQNYKVTENVHLIEAMDSEHALEAARAIGRQEAGNMSAGLFSDDRPARIVHAGVRKIVECEDPTRAPLSGEEVTYSEWEAETLEDVRLYATGHDIKLRSADGIRNHR